MDTHSDTHPRSVDAGRDGVHHVALVGLMGAGKSTVGAVVAQRLGWPLVDSDEVVQARTGMSVAQLWHRGGEAAYRPHEREAVTQTLAGPGPDVLTVPAGAVEDHVAVASLGQPGVFTVWLRAEVRTLAERVVANTHRPLLDDDPEEVLARQSVERAVGYATLADVILDVEGQTPEQLADRIIAALGGTDPV